MLRRAAIGVWLLVAACAHGKAHQHDRGPVREHREPRAAEVDRAILVQVLAEHPPGSCVELVEAELREGRPREGTGCDRTRREIARALSVARQRFGIVEHRHVDLVGMRFRLGVGRSCRRWPLRRRDDVLDAIDARDAGCRVSPYRGVVTIHAVDPQGRRHPVGSSRTDRDGYLRLELSDLDAAVRGDEGSEAYALQGLDAFVRLELGRDGWAGSVDLVRLRGFLADWHFRWIAQGRGVPALFAVRHPEHPHGPDAEAMAVEARVQRQEEDYQAVIDGRLPAGAFLQRHVWSPFRRAVEQLVTR